MERKFEKNWEEQSGILGTLKIPEKTKVHYRNHNVDSSDSQCNPLYKEVELRKSAIAINQSDGSREDSGV